MSQPVDQSFVSVQTFVAHRTSKVIGGSPASSEHFKLDLESIEERLAG
jgi:hypothetical protein